MSLLTIALLERIGLLLICAFLLTRIPSFKSLLERDVKWRTSLSFSILFGLFAIAGILAGIVIRDGTLIPSVLFPLIEEGDGLAHSGLVGIVMAGLLGGPIVGFGAGLIAGGFHFILHDITSLAYAYSSPAIGIFAGLMARFFSQERIISPIKSLFIGMFAVILSMGAILTWTLPHQTAIELVNQIGIPVVLINSLAIAIFCTMIRVVLTEKEQAQAIETKRALNIAEQVLPFLKMGLNFETAEATARLMMKELQPSAVAVTDTQQILAHIGYGAGHHIPGTPIESKMSAVALKSGKIQILRQREQIECQHSHCPLGAAILVPFIQSGRVAGLIILYFHRPQQIRAVDIALAQGLAKLISNQLSIAEAERMSVLMHEAELRTLQAQINPHFLFNTLNTVVTLIRIEPASAKKVVLLLAQFMRKNLKILSSPLIPFEEEMDHVQTYIELIHVRFSDRIDIALDVPPVLTKAYIPPSTLQPLIENSIQHGLKGRAMNGKIMIRVRPLADGISISISDNGSGFPPDLLHKLGSVPLKESKGNGVGIYNVNQRLISLLGERSSLHISNGAQGGCLIQFFIPYQTEHSTQHLPFQPVIGQDSGTHQHTVYRRGTS